MLLSGFYSLKYMSVPMFMVFKNTNNVLVTAGDWLLFNQPISGLVFLSRLGSLITLVFRKYVRRIRSASPNNANNGFWADLAVDEPKLSCSMPNQYPLV
jgi:hypothetical protein